MSITLTKLSETASTITLGWSPPPGVGGYVFYANGVAVSTGSPNLKDGTPRVSVKFSKTTPGPPFQVAAVCRQGGILLLDVGTYSETPSPPTFDRRGMGYIRYANGEMPVSHTGDYDTIVTSWGGAPAAGASSSVRQSLVYMSMLSCKTGAGGAFHY